MMPFGRVPLAVALAFALLVIALVRDPGSGTPVGEVASARPAETVPPLSIPRRGPGREPTRAPEPPPSPAAPGTPTTPPTSAFAVSPTTTGTAAPVMGDSTTTTTARSPGATTTTSRCPGGSVAWEVEFAASEDQPESWTVTISGTITNTADAPVRVGPVTSTIEVRPPPGSAQEPTVRLASTVEQERLAAGQSTRFNSTATLESTSPPALTATVVGRQWDDDSARANCSPP